MDKRIDVFIPVYNDEKNIARAITSCLEQKEVDVRVVVSDNCSTDSTFEIVHTLAATDSRIAVHQNETNLGLIKNMLRYMDLVDRPFYMFLCSDDFLSDPFAFLAALELFEKQNDLISVYSNIDFVDPNGKLIFTNTFKREEVFDAAETMRRSLISTRNKFGIPILHRTEFGKRHPYIEELSYSVDLWHSFKVGAYGTCGHLDRSCIGNTYTGKNLTRSMMKDALKNLKSVAELENIRLTKFEIVCQQINHIKTLCAKIAFFNLIVPLKTRINALK